MKAIRPSATLSLTFVAAAVAILIAVAAPILTTAAQVIA